MDRRTLLKIRGGIAALPALGKAIKGTGIKAIKAAGKVLPKVSGMPEWFSPLVNKIMKEGTDITPKASRLEDYETIKKLEIPSETGKPEIIKLTENKATGNITIESSSGGVADSPFEISYTPPKTDINVQTGEPVKYPGDFYVIENRPKPDYNNPGKVEFDYDTFDIDTAYSDLERLEKIGTGKIKDAKKIEQRAAGRKKVENDPYDDIMDRYPDPNPDNYRADGGLASFANGGKVKNKFLENESKNPELSPEELEEKYQQEINDLLTRPAPSGLNFTTEEGGQGGINLMFGPKTKKDNYPGFGPRIESNINPRMDIRDPRIGISYTSNPEDQTASRFGINIGPKGAYLGYTRNFANGGLTKTVPPAKGPDSQGVESLFKKRYR
jgi:hypothetical protein